MSCSAPPHMISAIKERLGQSIVGEHVVKWFLSSDITGNVNNYNFFKMEMNAFLIDL
jgi:hypothetical protein